jgi:hypothetical protein
MRPNTVALTGVLLALLAAGVRADDVELRTGRTLSGKIVKEDDASVTIEWRGGEMTIQRTQIKEIRRAPPPADPAPAAGKPATKKPAETAPQRDAPPKTPRAGKSFADRLAEIEAVRLTAWTEEPSVLVTETDAKGYKVVKSDGATFMKDERPSSPAGIDSLYVRNDADYGRMIVWKDGARQLYWYRLYWNEDAKEWRVNHPDLEAFQLDSARAKALAGDVCADQNYMVAANCDVQGIRYGMQGSTSYDAAKERAKLAEDCRKAMGSDAGGQALVEFHECTIRIETAKSPADKVRGAMERRAILHRLVSASVAK